MEREDRKRINRGMEQDRERSKLLRCITAVHGKCPESSKVGRSYDDGRNRLYD
jgi:hypothetical protein